MAAVGIVAHGGRPSAWELAATTAEWLLQRGHEVRLTAADAERCGRPDLAVPGDELAQGLDLLVGIGGDGTILRAVEMAADHDVPVLGVNAGNLGYLATVEPTGLVVSLKRFLAGSHQIEERMRLRCEVVRIASGSAGEAPEVSHALNEVVVERADVGHTIRLEVALGGKAFTSYVADGLIVATPTGSTAYAFSARGPIVEPRHRALLLVPVSPHMLFDRTLVLDAETTVDLEVRGEAPARVSVDGRPGALLAEGDVVRCRAAKQPARLVGFGSYDFHRTLREKFGLSDR